MLKLVVLTCLVAAVSAGVLYPAQRANVFSADGALDHFGPSTHINTGAINSAMHLLNKRYVLTPVFGNRIATPLAAAGDTFISRYHAAHFNPVPYASTF